MRLVGTALMALGLLAVAVAAGFFVAIATTITFNALLPPFRPEDDETLRELVPAALTYLAWGVTVVVVFLFGWRRLRDTR
jgi:hypothetical protein